MPVGWAIAGSAVVGAAASIYSSNQQADAAENAANNSRQTADNAQALQLQMYNTTRNDLTPYATTGQNTLNQLQAGVVPGGQFSHNFDASDLQKGLAPNYDFMLQQGQAANQNQAAVSSGLASGNALQGLQQFTQNYAGNAYQQAYQNYNTNQTNSYNRLLSLANLGENAAAQVGNNGVQLGNASAQTGLAGSAQAGQYSTQAAAAQGAGAVGAANQIGSGLTGWGYLQSQQAQPTLSSNYQQGQFNPTS